jgi:hypothetical protein
MWWGCDGVVGSRNFQMMLAFYNGPVSSESTLFSLFRVGPGRADAAAGWGRALVHLQGS